MEEVWFFFKSLETIFGILCMIFHIQGFLDDRQPLPHEMYFCGTFFGFTIIAIFGQIGITLGSKPSLLIEAIISSFAAFFFFICSIFSMYHAEKDYRLMYLDDYEESVHPFFAINKKQSIAALICGLFYLLHAVFAFDALIITDENFDADSPALANIPKEDLKCYQPIKLYICGKWIHEKLEKEIWFQKLMGKRVEHKENIIKIIRDVRFVQPKSANVA